MAKQQDKKTVKPLTQEQLKAVAGYGPVKGFIVHKPGTSD
jgi:hypothetical protein